MSAPITVVLLTYARTDYAMATVEAAVKNLRYPNLQWLIADDGSETKHVNTLTRKLKREGGTLLDVYSHRGSYGQSCNWALNRVRSESDPFGLTLFLEDDWVLQGPLDLWPFACTLVENEWAGMIRMGYLGPDLIGRTLADNGELYWMLSRQSPSQYVFAGHPSLRAMRFHLAYGDYPERLQPGDTELRMAAQVKDVPLIQPAPEVLWPIRFGVWGPWGHIGTEQSYVWNGGVEI